MSMAALARRLGKPSDWVTRRLGGRVEIALSDLDEICRELELEPVVEFRPAPAPKKRTTAGGSKHRRPSRNTQTPAKGNQA